MSLNVLTYLSEGRSGELIFKRMLSCSFNWNTSTVCVHFNSLNRQRSDWMGPFLDLFFFISDSSGAALHSKTLLSLTW